MSGQCVLIGDEVTAAGFRLAGVDCRVPEGAGDGPVGAKAVQRLLDDVGAQAGLILITAELAGALPDAVLADLLAQQRPPMLVIGDIRGRHRPADLTIALKRQLGLSE
jgi:vacuolar-type H+-ATPase subunit F/Vma7